MSPETAQLLQELRDAIHKSIGSREIVAALSALVGARSRVLLTVDAALDMPETLADGGVETSYSTDLLPEKPFSLTLSDERFLLAMRIAVDTEGSRPSRG
jgi:hypothetical protein